MFLGAPTERASGAFALPPKLVEPDRSSFVGIDSPPDATLSMPGLEVRSPLNDTGPSSTVWRRQRLLRIGSSNTVQGVAATQGDLEATNDEDVTETTSLQNGSGQSYGTLPSACRRLFNKPSFNFTSRRGQIDFSPLYRSTSNPTTPLYSPSGFGSLAYARLSGQRPISAYDEPLGSRNAVDPSADISAKINGIRVWYSSFSSIDWLHDAIKDSVRFSKLRKRRSFRARVRLAIDRSIGWVVVTIVGFLTAIVAFLVVRSEQWLFDAKEGYCAESWWKAKRFCCPFLEEGQASSLLTPNFAGTEEDGCPAWNTWAAALSSGQKSVKTELIEYISYAAVAVSTTIVIIPVFRPSFCGQLILALTSSLLTIYLTNSTTFVTRKESGVLSPQFSVSTDEPAKDRISPAAARRKVMYYVRLKLNDCTRSHLMAYQQAAGSGIPEIKTILSGALHVDRTISTRGSLLVLIRIRHSWLSRWPCTLHKGRWSRSLRCFRPLAWQRGSICPHCELHWQYCQPLDKQIREQ